jgi:hypothetical protein
VRIASCVFSLVVFVFLSPRLVADRRLACCFFVVVWCYLHKVLLLAKMFALLVGLLFMVVLYWVCYVCVVRHELVMSHNASWQLLRLACLGQAVYIVYIFLFYLSMQWNGH